MHGRPRRSRRRGSHTPLTVGMAAALSVLTLVSVSMAADAPSGLGHHRDDGRFTAQQAGFPPQPAEMTHVRALPATGAARSTSPGATDDEVAQVVRAVVAAAVGDARVAGQLGPSWVDHGAIPLDEAAGLWQARLGLASGDTLTADVSLAGGAGEVMALGRIDATDWQPPLTGDERRRAIDLARAALLDAGHERAAWLDGFAIHGLRQDGSWPDARWAYATFAVTVDDRPELSSWVDLTAGRVMSTAEQAPPQAPAPATRQSDGDQPESVTGEDVIPLRDTISWHGWEFTYELSHRVDGLSLRDGSRRGIEVFHRLSMPAMTVHYTTPRAPPASSGADRTSTSWACPN